MGLVFWGTPILVVVKENRKENHNLLAPPPTPPPQKRHIHVQEQQIALTARQEIVKFVPRAFHACRFVSAMFLAKTGGAALAPG